MPLDLTDVCKRLNRLKPLRFLNAEFARQGDTFESFLPDGTRRVTTRSPELTLQILVQKADAFGRINNPLTPLLLDGLLVSEGDVWRKRRAALQPRFARRTIEGIRPRLVASLHRFLEGIQPGDIEDFSEICRMLVGKVTVETLFSKQAWDPALLDVLADSTALAEPDRILGTSIEDQALWTRTKDALRMQVEGILNAPDPAPFLQDLLKTELSRDAIAIKLRSVLMGGQDTLSTVLLWAQRLRSESGSTAPVSQVVSETLRLHTPLYAFPRRCVKPVQLGDFQLQPGDEVVSWPHVIHRDERWWPDPLAFKPERFEEKPKPGTWVPFSLGHHNCIGKHFGRMLLEEALTALEGYTFEWLSPPPRVVPLITMFPMDPAPVRLRLDDRLAHDLQSPAYLAYNQALYGFDDLQFNQLPDAQAEQLFRFSNLTAGMRFIDLGCASGSMTEWIANETGASGVGLDISPRAIQAAQERTADRDDLTFIEGDLNDLPIPDPLFDVAFTLDSLHIPTDLRATLLRIQTLLVAGGRLVTPWTDVSEQERAKVMPEQTELGQHLDALGWDWVATEVEGADFWDRAITALEGLRDTFAAEGSLASYEEKHAEATSMQAAYADGRAQRFLFVIRPA